MTLTDADQSLEEISKNTRDIATHLDRLEDKPEQSNIGIIGSIVAYTVIGSYLVWNLTEFQGKMSRIADSYSPKITTENVVGEKEPEKFYDIGGKKFYLEIDGKPVSEYVSK